MIYQSGGQSNFYINIYKEILVGYSEKTFWTTKVFRGFLQKSKVNVKNYRDFRQTVRKQIQILKCNKHNLVQF